MRKIVISIVFMVMCALALNAFAQDGQVQAASVTPTKAIQDLDKKLDDYRTGPNLTAEDKAHNKKLKEDIIHGTFDVDELSRISLEKHWIPLTFIQRKDFITLMTDLLETRAILSKEQGQKKSKSSQVYNVQYRSESFLNKAKTRAIVKTSVYVKSEDMNVKLDYKLRKKGNEWKIYDVIMDGASLADNYKYQFDRIIVKNGYPELVARMQKKLDDIKTEDEADDSNNV